MHRTTIATSQVQVAPEIASYMHCACEPVTVHGCTAVLMIVPQLRSAHTVVYCAVKTMSCNTTPQAEGATLKQHVIHSNCVNCAHQHRERHQEHAAQRMWNHRALTSECTNLGGKVKEKVALLKILVLQFLAADLSPARSRNMRERAAHHSNCRMVL